MSATSKEQLAQEILTELEERKVNLTIGANNFVVMTPASLVPVGIMVKAAQCPAELVALVKAKLAK